MCRICFPLAGVGCRYLGGYFVWYTSLRCRCKIQTALEDRYFILKRPSPMLLNLRIICIADAGTTVMGVLFENLHSE